MNKIIIFITLLLLNNVFSFYTSLGLNVSVSFFDVGQGDSAMIKTTNNQKIIIDGGPDNTVLSVLGSARLPYIDLVILTHPHADHINGLLALLERADVGLILFVDGSYEGSSVSTFRILCEQVGNCRSILGKHEIKLSKVETLLLFAPECPASSNLNNCSIITKFSYLDFSVLFMGDAEVEEERWLIKNYNNEIADIDVLKAGHHCSRTASSESLIVLVSPSVAICSCGVGNKFGHPHQETLDILSKHKIQIRRTDEIGTILIKR